MRRKTHIVFVPEIIFPRLGHTNLFNCFTDFFQHKGCRVAEKKNSMQALKYPSAHAVTLYMPGFKEIN